MRVSRLTLRNFRCFEEIEFSDIPQTVVLVSPNGVGKSSVLEAIAGIKELVQPYHTESYQWREKIDGENWQVWPQHLREPLRVGTSHGSIEIEITPNDKELQILKDKGLSDQPAIATVEIHDRRRVRLKDGVSSSIKELFKYHQPQHEVGRIDQIRPSRFYQPKTGIGGPDALNDARERQFLSEFHRGPQEHDKFSDLKTYIHTATAADFSRLQQTGEHRDSLGTFIEVFNWFFAPKRLLGVTEPVPGRFEISVQTPTGEHDIDWLSDGEKEILNILGYFYRFRGLEDIVLWDTPELHLNATLETRILSALQQVAPINQYWIASHSLEFIDTVPAECLFALRQLDSGVRLERSDKPIRRRKLELYRDLGAQIALQLVASRVVFVEGEYDEQILRCFFPDISCYVRFVDSQGVRGVRGIIDQLVEASDDGDFFAILDRDDLDENEIRDVEEKKAGHVHVWRRREIENYLLEAAAIWEVVQKWTVLRPVRDRELTCCEDVTDALRAAADSTMSGVVAKKLEIELSSLRSPVKGDPQDLEGSLTTAYERRLTELEKIAPDNVATLVTSVRHAVQSKWEENWRRECLGKETFTKFLTTHFRDMNATLRMTFIEKMCRHLCELGEIPEELQHVVELIRQPR